MLIHFHGVGLVRCVAEHKDRASRHSYWLAVGYGSPRGVDSWLPCYLSWKVKGNHFHVSSVIFFKKNLPMEVLVFIAWLWWSVVSAQEVPTVGHRGRPMAPL